MQHFTITAIQRAQMFTSTCISVSLSWSDSCWLFHISPLSQNVQILIIKLIILLPLNDPCTSFYPPLKTFSCHPSIHLSSSIHQCINSFLCALSTSAHPRPLFHRPFLFPSVDSTTPQSIYVILLPFLIWPSFLILLSPSTLLHERSFLFSCDMTPPTPTLSH